MPGAICFHHSPPDGATIVAAKDFASPKSAAGTTGQSQPS
jgi:hypothetical protein